MYKWYWDGWGGKGKRQAGWERQRMTSSSSRRGIEEGRTVAASSDSSRHSKSNFEGLSPKKRDPSEDRANNCKAVFRVLLCVYERERERERGREGVRIYMWVCMYKYIHASIDICRDVLVCLWVCLEGSEGQCGENIWDDGDKRVRACHTHLFRATICLTASSTSIPSELIAGFNAQFASCAETISKDPAKPHWNSHWNAALLLDVDDGEYFADDMFLLSHPVSSTSTIVCLEPDLFSSAGFSSPFELTALDHPPEERWVWWFAITGCSAPCSATESWLPWSGRQVQFKSIYRNWSSIRSLIKQRFSVWRAHSRNAKPTSKCSSRLPETHPPK